MKFLIYSAYIKTTNPALPSNVEATGAMFWPRSNVGVVFCAEVKVGGHKFQVQVEYPRMKLAEFQHFVLTRV